MDDPRLYWVGFNLVKGIGAARMRTLLAAFGDAQSAWEASSERLQSVGLGPKVLQTLLQVRAEVDLPQVWQRLQAAQVEVVTWLDDHYPRRLNEIDQPPPVLYLRGDVLPEDDFAVAVVGTRRMSAYGRQVTEELAATLAHNGITVVSGLARGVDAIAHQAAIQAGGRTLAVLGSGLDQIYPPENHRLADQVAAHGAVLSDYPLGTSPDAANFPPRNRIISGLSKAVIVVEAGETSGALITASFAAEQGREVFAVPGSIYAPQCKGTNRLIRDGAHPFINCQDVLEVLNMEMVTEHRTARTVLPIDPVEAQLYRLLSHEPQHVDDIRAHANLPIEQVSATLALMELKGFVRQVGGMNYVVVRELTADYHISDDSPGDPA